MADTINVELSTQQPVVAANLTELRYLVFQGMTGDTGQSAYALAVELGFEGTEEEWIASLVGPEGPAGAPGTTLGWDVEDDGEGNVTMTYPDGEYEDSNAVRFTQQTLTAAQQTQARANIGATSATAVDDLNDTVREIDADVTALEKAAEEQASSENVLTYHQRAQKLDDGSLGKGFIFTLDETTGKVTITENQDPAVKGYTYGRLTYGFDDQSPIIPVAGVYRLEMESEQVVDYSGVYGRFYFGSSNHFVESDATGKSVEVYLDGSTPVVVNINASASMRTNVQGSPFTATVKPVLRRIGTPELGELLVDQINQMQALQRKALGMLDSIAGAYKYRNDMPALSRLVNSGLYPTKAVASVVASKDLNDIPFDSGSNYSVRLLRFNGETLHTPYAEGITSQKYGVVLDYHSGTNTGIQFALPVSSSDAIVCVRKLSSGTWGSWVAIGGVTSGT